jgi:hypothetical protein
MYKWFCLIAGKVQNVSLQETAQKEGTERVVRKKCRRNHYLIHSIHLVMTTKRAMPFGESVMMHRRKRRVKGIVDLTGPQEFTDLTMNMDSDDEDSGESDKETEAGSSSSSDSDDESNYMPSELDTVTSEESTLLDPENIQDLFDNDGGEEEMAVPARARSVYSDDWHCDDVVNMDE